MQYKTMIIDGNNLAYREYHKLPQLTSGIKSTSVIFGVLRSLVKLRREFNPEVIIFTWDNKINFRKEQYPTYKAHRKKDDNFQSVYEQIDIMHKEILPSFGVPSVSVKGMEADDIITVYSHDKRLYPIVVCSSDTDLYQIVDKNVSIYNWKDVVTEQTFIEKYKFPLRAYPIYKSLVGDTSDNIKGVKGIGEKRAKELMSECDYDIDSILKALTPEQQKQFKEALYLILVPYREEWLSKKFPTSEYKPKKKVVVDTMYRYDILSINVAGLI